MKTLLYLAALMVILQPMNQAFIYLNYNLNKTYIAEHLCINKAKPEMKCAGKCHLRKELQKDDEAQKKEPKSLKEISQVVCFFENSERATTLTASVKTTYATDMKITGSTFLLDIFHPPAAFLC